MPGNHAMYNFLRYNHCLYLALLSKINKPLQNQQPYLYVQSQRECRAACTEALEKLANATTDVIEPNDLKYMLQIFDVSAVLFGGCHNNDPVCKSGLFFAPVQ
jgi:hypothetical protein